MSSEFSINQPFRNRWETKHSLDLFGDSCYMVEEHNIAKHHQMTDHCFHGRWFIQNRFHPRSFFLPQLKSIWYRGKWLASWNKFETSWSWLHRVGNMHIFLGVKEQFNSLRIFLGGVPSLGPEQLRIVARGFDNRLAFVEIPKDIKHRA